MTPLFVIGSLTAVLLGLWLARRKARVQRLRQLADQTLDPGLLDMLRRHMPLYNRMPPDLQQRLQGLVNVFINDKAFFGSGGLEITDEMRLAVAGNACLLILKRRNPRFPGSQTIIIYPDTFVSHQVTHDGAVVHEGPSARAGESWHNGPVILSWADVLRGIERPDDGHNVVIHEFAHKLDEENGPTDGLPVLREQADYADWARIMTDEFEDLLERARQRSNRVLDEYGSTSPAEFFAVASEAYFERGDKMQQQLPELYALLDRYYGADPAGWA